MNKGNMNDEEEQFLDMVSGKSLNQTTSINGTGPPGIEVGDFEDAQIAGFVKEHDEFRAALQSPPFRVRSWLKTLKPLLGAHGIKIPDELKRSKGGKGYSESQSIGLKQFVDEHGTLIRDILEGRVRVKGLRAALPPHPHLNNAGDGVPKRDFRNHLAMVLPPLLIAGFAAGMFSSAFGFIVDNSMLESKATAAGIALSSLTFLAVLKIAISEGLERFEHLIKPILAVLCFIAAGGTVFSVTSHFFIFEMEPEFAAVISYTWLYCFLVIGEALLTYFLTGVFLRAIGPPVNRNYEAGIKEIEKLKRHESRILKRLRYVRGQIYALLNRKSDFEAIDRTWSGFISQHIKPTTK